MAQGLAHHAEVQEVTQFFVRAHGCHSLRLVHHPARAAGVRTGMRSPGLETALCGDTRGQEGRNRGTENVDKWALGPGVYGGPGRRRKEPGFWGDPL